MTDNICVPISLKKSGFSLVELLVVVAIIGVLAVVAVPEYKIFMFRAREAEVTALLSGLFAAEQSFYAEWGGYTSNFNSMAFGLSGRLFYNVGFSYSGAPGYCDYCANAYAIARGSSGTACPASDGTVWQAYNVANNGACAYNGTPGAAGFSCTMVNGPVGPPMTYATNFILVPESCNAGASRFSAGGAAWLTNGGLGASFWNIRENKQLTNSNKGY